MDENMEMEVVKPQGDALVEIEQSRAISETQAAMIIAKRFPRDTVKSLDRILNACARPGLAEVATYEFAKGGTAITGPAIRLAEAIAQNWGNLQFGIRELEQRNGESTVEAYAWDVETNTKQLKTFQVAHKRHTRKGAYKLEDPRDIYEMVANQGARRLRACILGVIPGDVVEAAVKQCEATLRSKAEVTPERIKNLVEKFSEYGVSKTQLEKRVQKHLDSITPAQMINLGKIYNSLKDGMSAPADWFEVEEKPSATDSLKDKLKSQGKEPADTGPTWTCLECGFEAKSQKGLSRHMTITHKGKKEPEQVLCEMCGEGNPLVDGHICRPCYEEVKAEEFRQEAGESKPMDSVAFVSQVSEYEEGNPMLAEQIGKILWSFGYRDKANVRNPKDMVGILSQIKALVGGG